MTITLFSSLFIEDIHTSSNFSQSILTKMSPLTLVILLFILSIPLLHLLTKNKKRSPHSNLPPGSLGIPFIGESLNLLHAMWVNKADQWLGRRIKKYGPISKLTLFGAPTVFVSGPAANKFVFMNDAMTPQQPKSILRIIGRRNLLELVGDDCRRVREAVSQFLKPEVLKKYVGRIDGEVRSHLEKNWTGRRTVKVLPLAKILTFDIISSLLFDIKAGPLRYNLQKDFVDMMAGSWAIPINLPFTNFSKSLKASKRSRKVLESIVRERKTALEQGKCTPQADLITYLISMELSDEEIVDNAMLVIVAGFDTTTRLVTFIIRHLGSDPDTYAKVAQEQEEIAKSKAPTEALTWDDLSKMKYTWRVALEILRLVPPVFGSFRKTLKDTEFNGYTIPKGWQVLWVITTTQMDPSIFPEPHKFDINRFEDVTSGPPYCFIPFGGGPRMCPGHEFARMETLVTIHHVVTRFKWKLRCKHDTFRRDPMPSPREGLPIELEPKNCVSGACI